MKTNKLFGAAALAAGLLGLGSQVEAANPATAEINPLGGGIPGVTVVRDAATADKGGQEVDFEARYDYIYVYGDVLAVKNNPTYDHTLLWDCDSQPPVQNGESVEDATGEQGDLLFRTCPPFSLATHVESTVTIQ